MQEVTEKQRKPSPRVARKRAERLDEIIRVATRYFNRRGFLATRMEELADDLGMNPATLYHYVKGKEELAYKVYHKSCLMRREQLESAYQAEDTGLGRIQHFMLNLLHKQQGRPAILSEIGALKPEWADEIRNIQRGNILFVQRMVADGVKDGSIARMDPFLAGIGILGIVEWMSFWYTSRLPYDPDDMMAKLVDIVTHGITKKSAKPPEIPRSEPTYPAPAPPNPFDREAMSDLKLQQFLRVAMESFNRVGVHATSIDQCAQQLNLTKGAFYYYFRNKEELLYLCYKRAVEFNWEATKHIKTQDPVEREILQRRSLFERHVTEDGPFPTYHHVTFLNPEHREEIMGELMRMQQVDENIVANGMAQSQYRDVDTYLAEKVRAGLTNWFPTWYSPKGRATPAEVADNHSYILLFGLAPR